MAAQFMPTALGACFYSVRCCSPSLLFRVLVTTNVLKRWWKNKLRSLFLFFVISFFFFFLSTVYHFDNARKVSDCKRVWAVTEYYLAFFVGRPPTPRSPTSLQWTSSVQTLTPLCTLLWVALSRRCAALLLWPCDTWTCFVFFFIYVNGVNVTYICTS